MKQTVLLTGATGFVGRQVLRALQARSSDLRLVVREGTALPPETAGPAIEVIETPDMFAESREWWTRACAGVDTVIHVAWYAEPGQYLHSPKNLDCLAGTLALARACVGSGVRRFVGVGTCFEYDLSQGYLSVDTPLQPTTAYAGAKAAAFLALEHYFPGCGVEFAWCRLFYLYGEGEDSRRLVPYVRERLEAGEVANLTSGEQIRDFMNVERAGRMIAEVAGSDRNGPVNICSSIPVTVRELVERIADEYGRRDLLRFGVRPGNAVDPPCVVGVGEE